MIPTLNNVWTSPGSTIVFVELKVNNRYVIAVYAYGTVWKVESL